MINNTRYCNTPSFSTDPLLTPLSLTISKSGLNSLTEGFEEEGVGRSRKDFMCDGGLSMSRLSRSRLGSNNGENRESNWETRYPMNVLTIKRSLYRENR